MKTDKMRTTIALYIFSWIILILGLITGGYLIIFRFNEVNSLIIGFLLVLGGTLLAVIIRMFGNIGQLLFDSFDDLRKLSCDSKDINQNIYQIKTFFEQIEKHLHLKK